MRRYETTVIIDPDLSEDDRTSLLTRIKEIIPQNEGIFIQEDLWGAKKLAYAINKKPRGYYARFDYCGMGPLVDELERFFRIDDRVMKYLTVQLDPDVDEQQILADLEAAQSGASKAASADETSKVDTAPAEESKQPADAAETTPEEKKE